MKLVFSLVTILSFAPRAMGDAFCCGSLVRTDISRESFQRECRSKCGSSSNNCCGLNPDTGASKERYAELCSEACIEECEFDDASFNLILCCGVDVQKQFGGNLFTYKEKCIEACGGDDATTCCGVDPDEANANSLTNGQQLNRREFAAACTTACAIECAIAPVAAPTPKATVRSRTGSSCFSSTNTVEVQRRGFITMDSLQVGDYVRAGKHRFSRVYGFIHLDRDVEAVEYLQIHADGLTSPLEISPDHMIFINNAPVRASQVKVGDMLGESKVNEIKSIKRRGMYTPVTESGDIVVSGVLASSYAAVLSHTPANQHFGAHAFFSVRRLVCAFDFEICENETYTNGYPDWLPMSTIHFFMSTEKFHPAVQVIATLAFLPFITTSYILELLILSSLLIKALVLVMFCLYRKMNAVKSNIKTKPL